MTPNIKKQKTKTDMQEMSGLFIFILIVFSLIVLSLLGYSLIRMHRMSINTTTNYVLNLSQQLTNMVDLEIGRGRQQLISIGDSFEQVVSKEDDEGLEEFLTRKQALCGFDFIALEDTRENRTAVAGAFPEEHIQSIDSLRAMETSLLAQESKACKTGIENEDVIYAMPLYDGDVQIGFLWAGNTAESMQNLISSRSFQGRTYSCIINKSGDLVLTSDQREKFQNLAYVFENKADAELLANMEQMKADIEIGKSGVFPFVSEVGDDAYLAYTPMYGGNRIMLTIVPTDILSTDYDNFILIASIAVVGTIIVFMTFLFLLTRSYRSNRKRLEHLAFYDEVTGGENNQAFCMKYRDLCQQTDARNYAVALLDVINFKEVNQTLGVDQGNSVLRHLYTVISDSLDKDRGEFVARSEMDRFFLCLWAQDSKSLQQRLTLVVEKFNALGKIHLPHYNLSFRMAAKFVTEQDTDPFTLEEQIRSVLKLAGTIPGKCAFYSEDFADHIRREQELDGAFESALASEEFQIYFQPKVSLKSGCVEGAEALIRWLHPTIGLVPPNEFISIFERNGKILLLDKYVFEKVCIWLSQRLESGKPVISVSVNLSRSHLMDENFLSWFVETADRYGVPHELIEFELTESTFMNQEQIQRMRTCIKWMHALGFRLSIDDFGVGYSSISLLREFDVDVLKLDRTFFVDLDDYKARDVVRCLVDLARKLNIQVVSEGIETKKQIEYMKALGCEVIQGYFFSKPLPQEEFDAWYGRFDFEKYDV